MLSYAHVLGAGSPAAPTSRAESSVLPRLGAGLLFSLTLLASFPAHHQGKSKRGGGVSLTDTTTQQTRARAGSPMPMSLGPAHPKPLHPGLCPLGELQGLLS